MAITNHERVGKSLHLLKNGLRPFVERELIAKYGDNWGFEVKEYLSDRRLGDGNDDLQDVAAQLVVVDRCWGSVFRYTLGKAERSLVHEILDVRNRWAHQNPFSSDDTDRALDSMARLLTSISAEQADEVGKMKMELRRVIYDEQVRTEKKKKTKSAAIESTVATQLMPWRDVMTPHQDVASGRYQQAEFAADLWQVHLGEGGDEYRDPEEFFRRTFLTDSLHYMLSGAIQRLAAGSGDPVVQLQTNFGGGKTHSMLALYHLFSGVSPSKLLGVDAILNENDITSLPKANRVVLVGNKISPGNPSKKKDGTVVRTLWGELAWQLGGKKAFKRIEADDKNSTNPGDVLRELMNEYGPCLILIDEWVAYARQLHDQSDLPAGGFETQFSFAQALTESAKLANNCLLVISLPASDTSGVLSNQVDDVEVGGQRGREALDRLRNVVGRIESTWRPASAEEGFEIVRRRLFQPLSEPEQYKHRDVVVQAFADLYRNQHQEFPNECRDADYEKRLTAAYPIHPEIFDRLYTDWSTLVKFQRTRGVLRLMAAVIHTLWEKGDRNPLIMPANISIDDPRVQFELTRYLPDQWTPVIEKDVDGPNSLPVQMDGEISNLGKLSACRRVARTIYLGSAPIPDAAHRGLEDRRVKLGCVMPGESPTIFGDALRRLSGAATYLYQDGPHYWYSVQPTVTKLAEDRAAQLLREMDKVLTEVERRVREDVRQRGDFAGVHVMPQTGQDVPDELDTRLVVLSTEQTHAKGKDSSAMVAANEILESRGNAPRLYRNALVFLAADSTRAQDLNLAVRRYIAWESIRGETDELNLTSQQVKQVETQLKSADSAVIARLPEVYRWLLVPEQKEPDAAVSWKKISLSGQSALAERVSKRLKSDELLASSYAPSRLRMEIDRVPLWRGDSVEIRQMVEDFARYLYLQRVSGPSVLLQSIAQGVNSVTWTKDSFAFAEAYDEKDSRYAGLRAGEIIPEPESTSPCLLVKSEIAAKQREKDRGETSIDADHNSAVEGNAEENRAGEASGTFSNQSGPQESQPKRYHGEVELNSARVGIHAGEIAKEVIAHLSGLVDADVTVRLEIEAQIPSGAPEHVVRTVTENSQELKFTSHGFEVD